MTVTAHVDLYERYRDADGYLHARLYYVHPRIGIPGYPLGEFMLWLCSDHPRAKVLSEERATDRDALAVVVSYPKWPRVEGYDPFPAFDWTPARAVPCGAAAGQSEATAAS